MAINALPFVILLLGLATQQVLTDLYYRGVEPKGENLGELASRLRIEEVTRFEREGDVWYMLVGEFPPVYTLPSGSPAYLFDEAGVLIEWVEDIGDLPRDHRCRNNSWCLASPLEGVLEEINLRSQ